MTTPFVITAIADDPARLDEHAVATIARAVAGHGGAAGAPVRLAEVPVVVELPATISVLGAPRVAARDLRRVVLTALGAGVDVAVRPDVPARRAPKLVIFDMDSTLIQLETIDELARRHGVGDQVVEITRRAMLGELDFEQSLRRRVSLLAGLDAAVLAEIAGALPLMPGAARLIRALRALGCRTAVASGGFTFATAALQRAIGLDDCFANTLEVAGGRVTGRLIDPVVTPEGKAAALAELAVTHDIDPAATVAVGDGANDLAMLEQAAFGVAFHAKPKLAAAADAALSTGDLDRLLFLFGLSADDIARLA